MQGAEERRLRRINNTPQGEAIDGNAADDALMLHQGGALNGLSLKTGRGKGSKATNNDE